MDERIEIEDCFFVDLKSEGGEKGGREQGEETCGIVRPATELVRRLPHRRLHETYNWLLTFLKLSYCRKALRQRSEASL